MEGLGYGIRNQDWGKGIMIMKTIAKAAVIVTRTL